MRTPSTMLLSRPPPRLLIGSPEAAGPIGAGTRREFGPVAGASSSSQGRWLGLGLHDLKPYSVSRYRKLMRPHVPNSFWVYLKPSHLLRSGKGNIR